MRELAGAAGHALAVAAIEGVDRALVSGVEEVRMAHWVGAIRLAALARALAGDEERNEPDHLRRQRKLLCVSAPARCESQNRALGVNGNSENACFALGAVAASAAAS